MTHLHIALFLCDTPHPKVVEAHGDYIPIFNQFLKDAFPSKARLLGGADEGEVTYQVDPYDVVHKMEYPSEDVLKKYAVIIMTGSAASAYEDKEWINKLVSWTSEHIRLRRRAKLIGICFGHQIIAQALSIRCVRSTLGWEVGPTPVPLTDIGKDIFGVDTLNIQQMHRDHIPILPDDVQLLGSTPTCYNQGMVRLSPLASNTPGKVALDQINILTLQGHPEYTEPIVSKIVEVRNASGIFPPELVADVEKRKHKQNDGVSVIGKVIWGILGVEINGEK